MQRWVRQCRSVDPTTADLRPEMSIRADVITGARTGVLMVPVTAVFNQQGAHVAYVVSATGTEARTVELGQSNDRMVEIVAGLDQGERVSLTAPEAPRGQESPARRNALQPR